jgi:hypothetical protein
MRSSIIVGILCLLSGFFCFIFLNSTISTGFFVTGVFLFFYGLIVKEVKIDTKSSYCMKCGTRMVSGGNFCPFCGVKVK